LKAAFLALSLVPIDREFGAVMRRIGQNETHSCRFIAPILRHIGARDEDSARVAA